MNKQNYHVLKNALMHYLSAKSNGCHQVKKKLVDLEKHHPELLIIFQEIIEIDQDPSALSILDHASCASLVSVSFKNPIR